MNVMMNNNCGNSKWKIGTMLKTTSKNSKDPGNTNKFAKLMECFKKTRDVIRYNQITGTLKCHPWLGGYQLTQQPELELVCHNKISNRILEENKCKNLYHIIIHTADGNLPALKKIKLSMKKMAV